MKCNSVDLFIPSLNSVKVQSAVASTFEVDFVPLDGMNLWRASLNKNSIIT